MSDEDLRRSAVVVLNDVDVSTGLARRLAKYVEQGGGLFVATGPRATWPQEGSSTTRPARCHSHARPADCLGANQWQQFRHVVLPGALPFIFTGLQISIGVSWFSLVAAEMVSGQYGLGYVINTSYTMVRYPTIVIGMFTLGIVGYVTSALVRLVGDYMMQWRVRELALAGQ